MSGGKDRKHPPPTPSGAPQLKKSRQEGASSVPQPLFAGPPSVSQTSNALRGPANPVTQPAIPATYSYSSARKPTGAVSQPLPTSSSDVFGDAAGQGSVAPAGDSQGPSRQQPSQLGSSDVSMTDDRIDRPFNARYIFLQEVPVQVYISITEGVVPLRSGLQAGTRDRTQLFLDIIAYFQQLPVSGSIQLAAVFRDLDYDRAALLIGDDAELSDYIGSSDPGYIMRMTAYLCGERQYAQGDAQSAMVAQGSSPINVKIWRDAVRAAWDTPFRGQASTDLLNSIIHDNAENIGPLKAEHYGNSVTILQSSGTGKSRMVHEMSRFVFTIPFNIRERTRQLVHPPADENIRNFMQAAASEDITVDAAEAFVSSRYRAMLGVLFRFTRGWLLRQAPRIRTYEEAVALWNAFLESSRREAYESLTEHLKTANVQNAAEAMVDELEKLRKFLKDPCSAPPLQHPSAQLPGPFANILADKVREGNRSAANEHGGSKLDLSTDPLIIIYFDEAHVLTSRTPQSAPTPHQTGLTMLPPSEPEAVHSKSFYDILLSVLNDLRQRQLFAVFLSTSSHIGQFAPPPALLRSARATDSKAWKAPITEVPFDCGPKLPISLREQLFTAQVSTIDFMAQFGRPLFWTLLQSYNGTENRKRVFITDLMALACAKLSGVSLSSIHSTVSLNAKVAVLDVRLRFDWQPWKANDGSGTYDEAELVASHMRLAYSVPHHRRYFQSGYSSEPILAEAAAMLMQLWMPAPPTPQVPAPSGWNPLDTLWDLLEKGIVSRGERGEVVARYILTRAYDQATQSSPGWNELSIFSAGCSVTAFIGKLFPDLIASSILDSQPDNVGGPAFRDAFKSSRIRFTHFVKLGDETGLSTTALCAAFIRGMAFIGHPTQPFVDLIIPILLDDAKPITQKNITALLIQVKCRGRAGTPGAYDFTAENVHLFADCDLDLAGGEKRPPYCTLLMELGVRATAKKSSGKVDISEGPLRRSARLASPMPTHAPRYNIRAYGCSSNIYGVIHPEDKYTRLLSDRDFSAEHARQANLALVWNMKPVWVHSVRPGPVSVNSYSWLDNADVQHVIPPDEVETEGVVLVKQPATT